MADSTLTYQGLNVEATYQRLAGAGMHSDVAREIIGLWIGQAARQGRRFGYSLDFPAHVPACDPAPFARSFEHKDWVDGESIVQAEDTPSEKGFNDRFHRIERDLDRLGALIAQAFICMNAMRERLSVSLGEVSAELNRLNADVADLRRDAAPPAVTGPLSRGLQFIGRTDYFGKRVMVWQDPEGRLVNLPDTGAISVPTAVEPRGPKVAEVFGRDEDIRRELTGPINKRQLVERFGDRLTQDGTRLADLLVTLPDEQNFTSLDALVDRLGDQDVALIQGFGGEAALRNSVGVAAGQKVAGAAVTQVAGVTPELAAALSASGVRTVAELKALSPERVVEIGRDKGVAVNRGNAARLVAMSKLLQKF